MFLFFVQIIIFTASAKIFQGGDKKFSQYKAAAVQEYTQHKSIHRCKNQHGRKSREGKSQAEHEEKRVTNL